MDFRFVDDEGVWNVPLLKQNNTQFLQSWEWGVFQQTLGREVRRVQIVDGDTPISAIQLIKHSLPLGQSYWQAPHGPVVFISDVDLYDSIAQSMGRALNEITRSSGSIFAHLETVAPPTFTDDYFLPLKLEKSNKIQPQDELAVITDFDETEILEAMHEKTRYNIRLASRHGVKVRLIEQWDYARRVFPHFWRVLSATAARQKIRTHPERYYFQMLQFFQPRGLMKLIIAEQDGVIIAGHILSVFGDTVYYLHGGSSYEHRQFMAPFALHWESIRLAKKLGKRYYNMGGVEPAEASNHPWQSLTRFKEGFVTLDKTGVRFHYLEPLDLVSSPFWYRIVRASRRARRYGARLMRRYIRQR